MSDPALINIQIARGHDGVITVIPPNTNGFHIRAANTMTVDEVYERVIAHLLHTSHDGTGPAECYGHVTCKQLGVNLGRRP